MHYTAKRGGRGLWVGMCSTQKTVAALVTRQPRPAPSSPVPMLCAALGEIVLAQSFTAWADNGNFLEGQLEKAIIYLHNSSL